MLDLKAGRWQAVFHDIALQSKSASWAVYPADIEWDFRQKTPQIIRERAAVQYTGSVFVADPPGHGIVAGWACGSMFDSVG